MSEWGIEIGCFLGNTLFLLQHLSVAYLPHQIDTIGNHNEDNTHILGKGNEQVAEILTFNDGVFLI